MLLAVGFVPVPPLLVPAVAAGASHELDACRHHCREVLATLRSCDPARLVVVGDGPSAHYAPGTPGTLAGLGLETADGWVRLPGGPASPQQPLSSVTPSMPLFLVVAAWLLADVGWDGPVDAYALPASSTKDDVHALAERIREDGDDVVLLAVGEGSARLDAKAPGSLDPSAVEWQEAATHALATADLDAILGLDPQQGAAFLATGRAPWQVAAAAAQACDTEWAGALTSAEQPYGVAYLTGTWTRE